MLLEIADGLLRKTRSSAGMRLCVADMPFGPEVRSLPVPLTRRLDLTLQ